MSSPNSIFPKHRQGFKHGLTHNMMNLDTLSVVYSTGFLDTEILRNHIAASDHFSQTL